MNSMRLLRGCLILLAALSVGSDALAYGHSRGRSHTFVRFGVATVPAWGYYYPSPFYYPYYSTAVVDRSPLVYIEQNPPPAEAPQPSQVTQPSQLTPSSYWYYCAAAKAYYPYVKACPSGWQKVLPQTPGAE